MGRTAHHAAAAFDLSRSFARSSSRCCIARCSLLVALELLGVSLFCVSPSCASGLQQHHLFDWGALGVWGDIGEHLLSLDWKIDGRRYSSSS